MRFATAPRDIYIAIMLISCLSLNHIIILAGAADSSVTQIMSSIFTFALVSLLSAIPLLPRQSSPITPSPITPFVARAFQSDSPVHLSNMNANDGHFWFGKATSTYCPSNSTPHCPMGTETALMVSSDGSASLVRSFDPATGFIIFCKLTRN